MNSYKPSPTSLGIYIHFPYCLQKCSYCDFYSVGLLDRKNKVDPLDKKFQDMVNDFVDTLFIELESRLDSFQDFQYVNTIFFGGGTASLLPPQSIHKILQKIQSHFTLSNDVEITLEGNPENFTPEYIDTIYKSGINRINVGLQTWDPNQLEKMNRYFHQKTYDQIINTLTSSKILDVGVDLIYGFPNQTLNEFQKDLDRVLNTSINHISIYSLTAEEGTVYGNNVSTKKTMAPEEDLQFEIFSTLPSILNKHNYNHYEISNFAKEGAQCKHNLRYWNFEPYLGLGPGAHGFTNKFRYANPRNIALWQKEPTKTNLKIVEPLTEFFTGYLRLTKELHIDYIVSILGKNSRFSKTKMINIFNQWVKKGYMQHLSQGQFQWTLDGLLFLDDRILEMSMGVEPNPS